MVKYWILRNNNSTPSNDATARRRTNTALRRTAFFIDSLARLVLSHPLHCFSSRCRAYGVSIGFTNGRCFNSSTPCIVLLYRQWPSCQSFLPPQKSQRVLHRFVNCFTHIGRKIAAMNGWQGICIPYLQCGMDWPFANAFRGLLLSPRTRSQHSRRGTTSRPRKVIEY